MKINFDSIYLKVLIPVLLLSSISLILLSYIIYEKERNILMRNNEQMLITKTEKLEGILYEKIEKWKKYAEVLSKDSEITAVGSLDKKIKIIKNRMNKNDEFMMILVADETGKYVTTLNGSGNISDRKYFVQIKEMHQIVLSEPVISKSTGKPIIVAAAPIFVSGTFKGAVGGIVNLDSLTDIINYEKIGKTGYAFMTDGDGYMLSHPEKDLILSQDITKFKEKGVANLVKRMLIEDSGTIYYQYKNENKVVSFKHLRGTRWSVASSIKRSEIGEEVTELAKRLIKLTIIILVLESFLIILLLNVFIILPVKRLKKSVERIEAGELSHRIYIQSNDEIGNLAESFNKMTMNLENDIKRRETSEADLRKSEERWGFALDGNGDGVWDWNFITEEMFLSEKALEILEIIEPHEHFNVNDMWGKISPEIKENFNTIMAHIRDNSEEFHKLEYKFIDREGNEKWILSRGKVTEKDSEGKPLRVIGTISDISYRVKALSEIIKSKELAESANYAKRQFLANMSHEIRTPMNGIIGFLELLELTEPNEEQIKYIQRMHTSAEALLKLINDILDFSKIEAGKIEIKREEINIYSIVKEIVDLITPKANKNNISVEYKVDIALENNVMGDYLKIRQVLLNIIGNAVKFTHRGKIEIICRLERSELSEKKEKVLFIVKDTGIGIKQEDLGKLFGVFSQVDNSLTKKYEGTGLGLAITKNIVEMMKGRIWMESVYGEGSTFYFTIEVEKIFK